MVKPYLTDKLNQSFPDPSKFTNDNEFLYAAKVSSVFKKVIAEILMWIEEKKQATDYLQKKQDGKLEVDKFRIGE